MKGLYMQEQLDYTGQRTASGGTSISLVPVDPGCCERHPACCARRQICQLWALQKFRVWDNVCVDTFIMSNRFEDFLTMRAFRTIRAMVASSWLP